MHYLAYITGFHQQPSGWLPIEIPGDNAIATHTHVSIYLNELILTPKFSPAAEKLLDGQPHDRPAWSLLDEGKYYHDADPVLVHKDGVERAHREAQQSIHGTQIYCMPLTTKFWCI